MFWRDLTKLIVVAICFAACLCMLADVIGFSSPWLGLLMMFNFMGLAKVAEPLFVLPLPDALRIVGPSTLKGWSYRWLGVRGFGDLLRNTPLRYLNNSVYRLGGKQSLAKLKRQAQSAEATHFWAAVLFTPYIVYVWSCGLVVESVVLTSVQIVFNVYPILHLRTVRARLGRVERVRGLRTAPQGRGERHQLRTSNASRCR